MVDYRKICEYAEKNDKLCIETLEESARILSTGLANLIGITNPEMVILSGDLFDESEYFYNTVEVITKEKLYSLFAKNIIFKKRRVKDSLYEIGAATMVFKSFFKD
jgi:predicted NBD/HSP70 family sugar kinase